MTAESLSVEVDAPTDAERLTILARLARLAAPLLTRTVPPSSAVCATAAAPIWRGGSPGRGEGMERQGAAAPPPRGCRPRVSTLSPSEVLTMLRRHFPPGNFCPEVEDLP